MLIKFYCLIPVYSCFYCLKKWNFCKKSGSSRSRLIVVVCSLNVFEIDLICWQLISVKATKCWLGLPY